MRHLNTIEKLTNSLIAHSLNDFPRIIKNANLSFEELQEAASWRSGEYTRNCLARNEKFELILLCWEPNVKTPVHNHGGEICWVYQAKGTIEEVRYDYIDKELIETNRMELIPGQLTFMNDQMGYHTIENNSEHRAMSLHIYACPIDNCKVFNEQDRCFESKELSYDNIFDLETNNILVSV